MTDELLPALPKPWIERGDNAPIMPMNDYFTADQMRAYAREAIRLSHTWPTLRDDDEMTTHPSLEGLIREWRESADMAGDPSVVSTLTHCANKLEAALAALPGGGVARFARGIGHSCEGGGQTTITFDGVFHVPLLASYHISPTPNPHEADRNG